MPNLKKKMKIGHIFDEGKIKRTRGNKNGRRNILCLIWNYNVCYRSRGWYSDFVRKNKNAQRRTGVLCISYWCCMRFVGIDDRSNDRAKII